MNDIFSNNKNLLEINMTPFIPGVLKMVTCYSKLDWIGLNYNVKTPICFKLEKHVTIFWDTLR